MQHGANINSGVLDTGVTPLMFACLKKDYNLIQLLLKLGSDIKIVDKKNKWNAGFYLLAKSSGNEKELSCMKLLVNGKQKFFFHFISFFKNFYFEAGLDLTFVSEDTKLTMFIFFIFIFLFLLKLSTFYFFFFFFQKRFSFCASQGNLLVLEHLLDNGSNIEICGPDLINFAVSKLNKIEERKQKELIQFVTEKLEKVGKLKIKNEETDTPLSIAATTGNDTLIYYLLEDFEENLFVSKIHNLGIFNFLYLFFKFVFYFFIFLFFYFFFYFHFICQKNR